MLRSGGELLRLWVRLKFFGSACTRAALEEPCGLLRGRSSTVASKVPRWDISRFYLNVVNFHKILLSMQSVSHGTRWLTHACSVQHIYQRWKSFLWCKPAALCGTHMHASHAKVSRYMYVYADSEESTSGHQVTSVIT